MVASRYLAALKKQGHHLIENGIPFSGKTYPIKIAAATFLNVILWMKIGFITTVLLTLNPQNNFLIAGSLWILSALNLYGITQGRKTRVVISYLWFAACEIAIAILAIGGAVGDLHIALLAAITACFAGFAGFLMRLIDA